MGSTMTDNTEHKPGCEALGGYGHGIGPCSCSEAQPEALRQEVHQECADFATSLRSAANTVHLEGKKVPPSFLRAADLFERAAAELRASIPDLVKQCLGIDPVYQFQSMQKEVIDISPARKMLKAIGL